VTDSESSAKVLLASHKQAPKSAKKAENTLARNFGQMFCLTKRERDAERQLAVHREWVGRRNITVRGKKSGEE
jgi:hypothetical protein